MSISSVPPTDNEVSILEQLADAFEEDRRKRIAAFDAWRSQFQLVLDVDDFAIWVPSPNWPDLAEITPELQPWLVENMQGDHSACSYAGRTYFAFDSLVDAALFKLRWA